MLTTTQQVFDKVAVHLLTQNEQSMNPSGAFCKYRGANGLSCAVGCLVDDKHYDPQMEDKSPDCIEVMKVLRHTVDIDNHGISSLLNELQLLHDGHEPKEWFWGLASLAKEFGLSTTILLKHQGY